MTNPQLATPHHTSAPEVEFRFWRRNLYITWVAQLIAGIGASASLPFLPLFITRELGVQDLESAKLWSGLVFSAPFVLAILTAPLWGVFGDRYGRKLMVIRAFLGFGIAVSLAGLTQNVEQLFAVRFFQGAVSGFTAACIALIASTTPPIRTGYALGFLETSFSTGFVIGPLIGGVLADVVGMRPVFFAVGGLCLLSAIVIALFVREEHRAHEVPKEELRFRANISFVWRNALVLRLMALLCLCQLAASFTGPILPFYVELLGAPSSYVATIAGLVAGVTGLCRVIGAPWWGRRADLLGTSSVVSRAAAISAVAVGAYALAWNYWVLLPLAVVLGFSSAALLPTLYAGISAQAPAHRRGGIVAIGSTATMVGFLLGPMTAGAVAAQLSMRGTFVAAALLFVVVVIASRRSGGSSGRA